MNYNLKYFKQNYLKKINYYNMPTKKINYFYIGHPVKVLYFLIIKKKRRYFNFSGFCISFNLSNFNFTISGSVNNQYLKITFPLICPFIIGISRIYKYNILNFRISKIYFKNKIKIKNVFNLNLIYKKFLQYNIYNLILNKFFAPYYLSKKKRKYFKKIKKKFRY